MSAADFSPIVLVAYPVSILEYESTLRPSAAFLYDALEYGGQIMLDNERVAALQEILRATPNDAFARYALGLEYSGAGEADAALAEFDQLLATHPEYTNGYFMAAQVLDRVGRTDDASAMLTKGIDWARRSNNRHAQSEMEAMLEELQTR